jgi:hypothetical protein
MGAIVRHCVGINFARCSNFSSSSLDHSILRMPGSSHSDHRALHCLGVFRARSEDTRAHWFRPYFETEALRISSSMLVQTPPLTTGIVAEYAKTQVARCQADGGTLNLRAAKCWSRPQEFFCRRRRPRWMPVKLLSFGLLLNYLAHAGISYLFDKYNPSKFSEISNNR